VFIKFILYYIYYDLNVSFHYSYYSDKPLALYLFGTNMDEINLIINNTSSGNSIVNETVLHATGMFLRYGILCLLYPLRHH
jgi:hypothetical protein